MKHWDQYFTNIFKYTTPDHGFAKKTLGKILFTKKIEFLLQYTLVFFVFFVTWSLLRYAPISEICTSINDLWHNIAELKIPKEQVNYKFISIGVLALSSIYYVMNEILDF